MIKSVKVTGGYGATLPALKGRTFEFTPGINILFGPNGCGKTTLSRMMAAYCGVQPEGGWTTPEHEWKGKDFGHEEARYPDRWFKHQPGAQFMEKKGMGKVEWNGTPVFLHSAEHSDDTMIAFGMPDDGLMDDLQRLFMKKSASAGQNRLHRLNLLAEVIAKPPDFLGNAKVKMSSGEGSYFSSYKEFPIFQKYIRSLKPAGGPTLITDEMDRSLDLAWQAFLFSHGFKSIQKITKAQIIIATHSPFAFAAEPEANIIDMVPGCVNEARRMIAVAADGAKLSQVTLPIILDRQAIAKAK